MLTGNASMPCTLNRPSWLSMYRSPSPPVKSCTCPMAESVSATGPMLRCSPVAGLIATTWGRDISGGVAEGFGLDDLDAKLGEIK